MPSARPFGICIAAGLVIGSGGGSALDIIANGAILVTAIITLIAAILRRSTAPVVAKN